MTDNHLYTELKRYTHNSPSKKGTIIRFIRNEKDLQKIDIQENLKSEIRQSFDKKENKHWCLWQEEKSLLVAVSKDDLEDLRQIGANVIGSLQPSAASPSTEVVFENIEMFSEKETYALLEGMLLSSYHFDKYLSKKKDSKITLFISETAVSEQQYKELNILLEAISLTKNAVNEPANYMDALKFSEWTQEAGEKFGFETEILHKKQIETLKMGGLLGVNKGSETPPTFNIMHYKPKNAVNSQPLVLVGKGVMFDTGGYSLKVGGVMSTMKCDMAGGAAVLGAMCAIAGNQLPYYAIGIVPATDNKISSNALVVDDVITIMDGTTVEVQNTDAEGRLVLADALCYAKKFNPELVIDVATLTGASAAITGSFGIAGLSNHQESIDALKSIGEEVYERIVQLPLWKEYGELIKSDIADLKNIGGTIGGVSTAAKFLEHFTDYPWVHLDIAGAAFLKDKKGYKQSGATAVPVRLIYEFVKSKC
ncbi:leucyl aminopeptidase family protein [Capnocytophaga cynodegmi]|uniref:Cytosol aminopeptidase domain-containing protein n=1 Tax=Capnocytophaga cynodegmi TaxID=28189 RepID=A0A0B7HRT7_9FLAO|nr:leucyl aminopeptidase [Capnocytophaga cynodegmi]CEN34697.1 conserved hypothetical protein [Capnocytophaga cynodegmi]CEN41329.1 conserved hypothetical protein [Capnocytophaga cynodegmi]